VRAIKGLIERLRERVRVRRVEGLLRVIHARCVEVDEPRLAACLELLCRYRERGQIDSAYRVLADEYWRQRQNELLGYPPSDRRKVS